MSTKKATETKKTQNTTKATKKGATTMTTETKKTQNTETPVTEEKKAPARTIETVRNLLTKLPFEHDLIDVKPAGVGVKTSKTRVCAVYVTRQNGYRVKTNKLAVVDQIINTYSASLETKLTSDKRDYEISGTDLDDDMLLTMVTELASGVYNARIKKAEAKMEAAEKKAAEKAEKQAEKKAAAEKAKAEKKAKKEAEKKVAEKEAK